MVQLSNHIPMIITTESVTEQYIDIIIIIIIFFKDTHVNGHACSVLLMVDTVVCGI